VIRFAPPLVVWEWCGCGGVKSTKSAGRLPYPSTQFVPYPRGRRLQGACGACGGCGSRRYGKVVDEIFPIPAV